MIRPPKGKREIRIGEPSEKQKLFLKSKKKQVGFGGARGGGKSWVVREKAKLSAFFYAGIRILIVRRTYPELEANHIRILRKDLLGIVRYNDRDKLMTFPNGSTISFKYCARDKDLDHFQGQEYDLIFLDEATQLSEFQIKSIYVCLRGANDFPKRMYLTCNPGGQGHQYFKRVFIDRDYREGENPDDYEFIQSLVTDNKVLMEKQPEYKQQLEALPPKLRAAWLFGRWDVFEGMFFEEFRTTPDPIKAAELGLDEGAMRQAGLWTHVVSPFDPPHGWTRYRSYDFGYGKPFSCAWWVVSPDDTIYRILELYGCTDQPNEGVKMPPSEQFRQIAQIEKAHPWLAGHEIHGIADPSIWDGSRGKSIYSAAVEQGLSFSKGVNDRIPGWMQVHFRLGFDQNGRAKMYFFENCKAAIRTIPLMMFSNTVAEDLDTNLEDHACDEIRYMCMSRPILGKIAGSNTMPVFDPLEQFKTTKKERYNAV